MEQRIWISFDLGVRGDYDGLYQWLDEHDAVECGNGCATLLFDFDEGTKDFDGIAEQLISDLGKAVETTTKTKIYVVTSHPTSKGTGGTFLFGNRRSNPWDGYANKGNTLDE